MTKAALRSSSSRFKSSGRVPLVYYVFDILFLEGKDLREQPLTARRKLLTNLLKKASENVQLFNELRGSKEELLRVAKEFGLEGLVAKGKVQRTKSGRRSGAWVKFKIAKSQEFVIGGYTLPEGGPQILRILASRLPESGRANLRRKSRYRLFRKGLSKPLRQVAETETAVLPLYQPAGEITRQMGTWDYAGGHAMPPVGQTCKLVAQIKFTEWTHDGQLRQSVFLGLRTDKEAKDVVRE